VFDSIEEGLTVCSRVYVPYCSSRTARLHPRLGNPISGCPRDILHTQRAIPGGSKVVNHGCKMSDQLLVSKSDLDATDLVSASAWRWKDAAQDLSHTAMSFANRFFWPSQGPPTAIIPVARHGYFESQSQSRTQIWSLFSTFCIFLVTSTIDSSLGLLTRDSGSRRNAACPGEPGY